MYTGVCLVVLEVKKQTKSEMNFLDDGLHVWSGHSVWVVKAMKVVAHAEGWCVHAAGARGRLAVGLAGLRIALVLAVTLLALAVLAVGLDVL